MIEAINKEAQSACPDDQDVFKAMDIFQKGKSQVHDRLKLIRFTDREQLLLSSMMSMEDTHQIEF